jgi:hypothetical protein
MKIRILCAVSLMGLMGLTLGCTHANISSVPQMIGGKAVFTYQGRANFGHQMKAADREMISHCAEVNGGSPVAIDRATQDLGYVVSGNTTAGLNAMGNQNQIIKFTCER